MNGKKTLLRSPQRKDFIIHLQGQQSLILRLHSLTQWGAFFRKRLENFYLACMVHRNEAQRLLYYYDYNGEVLIHPINRLNLLRSESYLKKGFRFLSLISYPSLATTMIGSTLVKGHNKMTNSFLRTIVANHIRSSPVVAFQRYSTFLQNVLKLDMHKHLSVFIQRREIFDHMQKYTLYNITPNISPRMRDKSRTLRQIWRQEDDSGVANQDTDMFSWSDKALLGRQLFRQTDIVENKSQGKDMERMGRISLTRIQRVPIIPQENIRSMKPDQEAVLKSVYGGMRYIRANSGMERTLTTRSGEFGSNMDLVKWDWKRKYFRGSENLNSREVTENSHLKYERKDMERMGRVSLRRTRRLPMITQEAIRSTKPKQEMVLKSVYGDMCYIRANSGMERTLTARSGEISLNMDLIKWDWKRKYFRGSEYLNSHEVPESIGSLNQPENIGPFNQKDSKLIQQKHLPVFALRQEGFDRIQADPLYVIPPPRQVKVKKADGYFDSIPTKIKEYFKAIPLNGEKISFNGTRQIQNPVLGKKETENRGGAIDYQKVADRVYDILTRRIIREKERMGELL